MKKQIMTLALLAVAGLGANAQQLPNVGFNTWKTECGKTFQASTKAGLEAASESNAVGLRKRPGVEPDSWNGSNVDQMVLYVAGTSQALVTCQSSDDRGNYVKLANSFVGIRTVGATAPAYITFGTPWVYACASSSDQDGGTYGGMDFKYRPDAIRGLYKRTNVSGKTEKAHIIAYFWTGTFTSNIGKNHPGIISKSDVDRAIMGKSNAGTITGDGKLIASADYEFATTANDDWQEIVVPIDYKDLTTVPSKMNVIISSADYWNRSNIVETKDGVDGSVLEADDIEFVYYHALTSATYNDIVISGLSEESNQTDFDLSDQVYNENSFEYTVKGAGATVEKNYDQNTGVLTVTVKGNDYDANPESKTVYTFQFKKVVYSGLLSDITVNGQQVKDFDEATHYYTVVGDYTGDNCVVAQPKNDDFTQTEYDADTRIYHISVLGGSDTGNYYVKFAKATTDYDGKMTIAMAGSLLSAATSTVGITAPADGKADFQLLNFSLEGLGLIGDIFVTDVPYAEKDGVVTLHKEQTINIFGEMGAVLGDLPIVLNGTLKDGKLTANIDIAWSGLSINVSLIPLNADCLDLSTVMVDLSSTPIEGMKADMANDNFMIILPEGTEGTDGNSNVVVGSKCGELSIDTDADFGVSKDFTAATVKYNRVFTISDNYVQSFVLPFGFTVPAGTTVAELSSVNGDNLVFKPVTETVANKPYLVLTKDEDFVNSLTNVEVKATTDADLTTTVDGVSHIGSYTTQNVVGVYGYAEGKFVKANTGKVLPFRTYIKVADAQAAPKAFNLSIDNGNGTVTAISHATVAGAANVKEAIYNLQGVRVSGDLKHLTKGVYIVNGQKVVVK